MRKIIFIDDKEEMLELVRRILEDAIEVIRVNAKNFEPLAHEILVHDCSIEAAPCNEVSVVMCDYDWDRPDMINGLMFLRLYRESNCRKSKTMKLILVSARLPDWAANEIKDLEIVTMAKPFSSDKLRAMVNFNAH